MDIMFEIFPIHLTVKTKDAMITSDRSTNRSLEQGISQPKGR